MGKKVPYIEGVRYLGTGEAICGRFLSRRDKLIHIQQPLPRLAISLCGLRYNIYRRPGMRGFKGIPTKEAATCLMCIALESP